MECKCHIEYRGQFTEINRCPLCEAAPALLAACEATVQLHKCECIQIKAGDDTAPDACGHCLSTAAIEKSKKFIV